MRCEAIEFLHQMLNIFDIWAVSTSTSHLICKNKQINKQQTPKLHLFVKRASASPQSPRSSLLEYSPGMQVLCKSVESTLKYTLQM